jgi:hypothetical protein
VLVENTVQAGGALFYIIEYNCSQNSTTFSYLFIHNQSNRGGDLDAETKTVLGQAGDANAMCLANQHDVLVTSLPFEQSYLDYWTKFLHLNVAQRFVPEKFNTDLLTSVMDCKDELVEFIKQKQKEGIVKKKLILSVFEADDIDIQLLKALQDARLATISLQSVTMIVSNLVTRTDSVNSARNTVSFNFQVEHSKH